jgi:hypothetical protein
MKEPAPMEDYKWRHFIYKHLTNTGVANVKDYGASGDGSTDDTRGIQAAIDAIKNIGNGVVYFPTGTYKVTSTLDFTGIDTVVGTINYGMSIVGDSMNASRILGVIDGSPIIDLTDSNYCLFENLRITGDSTTMPDIGILMARDSTDASAAYHRFTNVFVEGSFTKGGVYVYGSEELYFDKFHVTITGGTATYCMAFANTNFDSVSSPYKTINTTSQSTTQFLLRKARLWMNTSTSSATCLYIYGLVRDLDIYGGYMNSWAHSHIKMYSVDASDSVIQTRIYGLRAEAKDVSNPTYSIFMTGGSAGAFSDIIVEGCSLYSGSENIYQHSDSDAVKRSRFVNNRFDQGDGYYFDNLDSSYVDMITNNLVVASDFYGNEVINRNTGTITLPSNKGRNIVRNMVGTDGGTGDNTYYRIVDAREIRTLANDATPSVKAGNHFITGGTTTITDFDDGITGQTITVIAEHSITITDGTNIFLNGSVNFDMTATDTLTLICKADNKWYEIARSDSGA